MIDKYSQYCIFAEKCFEVCHCKEDVTDKLACGHEVTRKCFEWDENTLVCPEMCQRVLPGCGHVCDLP